MQPPSQAELSPLAMAGGDLQAIGAILGQSTLAASQREGLGGIICIAEALAFARLGAAKGCSDSRRALVDLLMHMARRLADDGQSDLGDCYAGQALVMAEHFARQGDEMLDDFVVVEGTRMSAAAHLAAQHLRAELRLG